MLKASRETIWVLGALAVIAALLLARLSAFGIWDPWELTAADLARRAIRGEAADLPHAGPLVVGAGFAVLGVAEWSGRLPIALCGLLTVVLTYLLVRRFGRPRAALYAVVVAGTSPLFIFNSRAMLGDAPAFAVQTAIALCAACAVLGSDSARTRLLWLLGCLALCALGVATRGALVVVLPPLLAAAGAGLIEGAPRAEQGAQRGAAVGLAALAGVLALLVAQDVIADRMAYSMWLGGQPQAGTPPSFDSVIGRVFHSFAPWSALLPLAFGWVLGPFLGDDAGAREPERRLRVFLLLWIAAGYGAQTLFISRYGDGLAFIPVAALAAVVALYLHDVERSGRAHWPAAVAALFLTLLLVRDYAAYPVSPVRGLPVTDFTVPEVFNPKRTWGAMLSLFGVAALLLLAIAPRQDDGSWRPPLGAPYRLLRELWQRSLPHKAWLMLLALALAALLVLGALAMAAPDAMHLSTLGRKWLRRLLFVPLALPVTVAALQTLWFVCGNLARFRLWPVLAAGLAIAVYAAQGFMPAVSAHFSPREIYDTYNALAKPGEALAEYKVGSRAAAYYAEGEVVEVETMHMLLNHLDGPGRRWAAVPADELADIDRMYRRRHKDHLFVADARSARVLLVTNQDIPGRKNESFLVTNVLSEPPKIQHPVSARFERKIEFLGYDLELPHGDYVGAGESFTVTWYFRSIGSTGGNWKMFVHIDAQGKRIHGDHYPLDGKYPIRMWDRGDIIVDRQTLDVPNNYPSGPYTMYLGFYEGETRMKVEEGPRDDANRVNAGVLRIR